MPWMTSPRDPSRTMRNAFTALSRQVRFAEPGLLPYQVSSRRRVLLSVNRPMASCIAGCD
jgi:hypothetical protein